MPYFKHIEAVDVPETHPVGRFYGLWQALPKSNGYTRWGDVRAEAIVAVMPWLLLLEKEGANYVYRVCGSNCERIFGMSYQGKLFGDGLPEEAVKVRLEEFQRVATSGLPLFSSNTLPIPNKETREVFRGVFGFANKEDQCNWMAVVIAPQDEVLG